MADCIFCAIVAGKAPASRVYEDDRFLSFMDIYPWRPGHTLVIPKRHGQRVGDLDADTNAELFALGVRISAAVRASGIPCDDVGFVLNDGPAANQSVPHVHLHVLPRTRGDLWRLGVQLLKRPALPLLGAASRAELDGHAQAIAAQL